MGTETIARKDPERDGCGNEETGQEKYGVRTRIGNETMATKDPGRDGCGNEVTGQEKYGKDEEWERDDSKD